MSDCGQQFMSEEFNLFCRKWSITHRTSSPGHQQCNGKAEAAVKLHKNMLKRTLAQRQDQWLALLELRNTPRQDTNASPAQVLFGRSTRSILPTVTKQCNVFDTTRRHKRRETYKRYYDKHTKLLPPLYRTQSVMFQIPKKKGWEKGKIIQQIAPRSYIVQNQNGTLYRRNRINIRPRPHHSDNRNLNDCDLYDVAPPELTNARRDCDTNSSEMCCNSNPPYSRSQRTRRQPAWFNDFEM